MFFLYLYHLVLTIAQYTNTFLLMGYQTVTDDDGATLHKVEVSSLSV